MTSAVDAQMRGRVTAVDAAIPQIIDVADKVLSTLEQTHPEIAGDPRLASEIKIRIGMALAPLKTSDPMTLAGIVPDELRQSVEAMDPRELRELAGIVPDELRQSVEAMDPRELRELAGPPPEGFDY